MGQGEDAEMVEGGKDQEEECEEGVVNGEDAERPAGVEVAEVGGLAPRVQKDARDEEPGKHEEEVNAGPAGSGDPGEEAAVSGLAEGPGREVMEADAEDRESAQAIEGGESGIGT